MHFWIVTPNSHKIKDKCCKLESWPPICSIFDGDQFTRFIRDFLNRFDCAPITYRGKYIPDAYKQHIKTLKRIGEFNGHLLFNRFLILGTEQVGRRQCQGGRNLILSVRWFSSIIHPKRKAAM